MNVKLYEPRVSGRKSNPRALKNVRLGANERTFARSASLERAKLPQRYRFIRSLQFDKELE